jgi:hypothetical protein
MEVPGATRLSYTGNFKICRARHQRGLQPVQRIRYLNCTTAGSDTIEGHIHSINALQSFKCVGALTPRTSLKYRVSP